MKRFHILPVILLLTTILPPKAQASDGSELWLKSLHDICSNIEAANVTFDSKKLSPTLEEARKILSVQSLGGYEIEVSTKGDKSLGTEGYEIIRTGKKVTIFSRSDIGALYGAFALLRLVDSGLEIPERLVETPAFDLRILNHWDNLNGTVERGYAGRSLWDWTSLPDYVSPRYEEYARANASIGINGTVLNNVNASPQILTSRYLEKIKTIADIFRPYGLKVYLSVNFASPMTLDSLPTADPLDAGVRNWWKKKTDEIYALIPDFGGFLVKANSEGQPGPMDFGRTHADGANMLARALASHGGIVMWRSFVYSPIDADRAKQAYMEFQPLDGQFDPNVIIQIKNGPVDFQPREPYSPLFGAMPRTSEMVEFQVTQEYLGHSNHIAYLATMWKEFYEYVSPYSLKAVAGVANIGDDTNWTGHPAAQANWYAFGRLAWNPELTSAQIADEWLAQTLADPVNTPAEIRESLKEMLLSSREAVVDYMMPLGLHHIFAFGHHYGPEPWCDVPGARPDWLPKYYHRADSLGIGFDRSPSGSNAVEQYPEPLRSQLSDMDSCPKEFLLWFHHVPWAKKLKSGLTLWDEMCIAYQRGCDKVVGYQNTWNNAEPYIDPEIFTDVQERLMTQARDAQWWKDACISYFQTFSNLPIPSDVAPPVHTLRDMMDIKLGITNYEAPGLRLLNSLR
ncbi:MAG: alpha-glucuronidase [Duncaniella sp.]|nr:alpha-glucuronidase [Muribaculum sp.]MCM1255902.1 alpha-glucuronidase [Duncaniella sp.]